MRPNPNRVLNLGLPALLSLLALPLAGDAAAPVPAASRTPACLTIDAPPAPVDRGDEKFFAIPGGVPNVMVLLDTSGSMRELPNPIPFPAAGTGTCAAPLYASTVATITNAANAAQYNYSYDNGFATTLVTDAPPWAAASCGPGFAGAAADNTTDACLYRAESYYKAADDYRIVGALTPSTFNTNPCAAVYWDGTAMSDGWTGTRIRPANVTDCTNCLASSGYYLWTQNYRDNWGRAQTTRQAVFKGKFLNIMPPKFVAARKVVKDLAKLDPAAPKATDQIRLGLTIFAPNSTAGGYSTGLRAEDGGRLMVPLGPNCDDALPPSQVKWQAPRQALIDAVNKTSVVDFNANTPLAEALFNVGQYFSAPTYYQALFGASWVNASFAETSAGLINANWTGVAGKRQASYCWSCQSSSVVVVTDGAPNYDSNLPKSPTPSAAHSTFNNDFRTWSSSTIDCPACGNDLTYDGTNGNALVPNALHKVAYFLNQTDLRPDLPNGTSSQKLNVYTISFGLDAALDPAAIAVLQKTADLGGGIFKNTSSAAELSAALSAAVNDVVARTTSFSTSNANSLQTTRTEAADTYVGRFKPSTEPAWEGHLFSTQVFDEFARGCDSRFSTAGQPTISCGSRTNPNLNGNETADGKAVCTDAYLIDKDCDPILENSTGNYLKGTFDPTTHQLIATPDAANLFWDAGQALSDPTSSAYKSAAEGLSNSRKLWTTIDTNADGLLTAADGLVEFSAANAAALAPSMSLDFAYCVDIMQLAGICGAAPMPACPVGPTLTAAQSASCAAVVINYVRGWDVLDADGDHCAGPGAYSNTNPWGSCTTSANCNGGVGATCNSSGKCVNTSCANGEQRDRVNDSRPLTAQRFWKLGDIFHSSPVLVRPPIDKLLCLTNLYTQCAPTIFSPVANEGTQTPIVKLSSTLDAYDAWRQANIGRQQFVLVGANDGMLHAFDAGLPDSGQAKLYDGSYPFGPGSGTEMWGYIPPDLLPRLKDSLKAHQYFVDGTTMVRDVWVDFNKDGIKQQNEFRTVAVISERGGGIRRTALDVTVPTAPVFLWTFPQNCSSDSLLAGQSWGEFLPRPPPIGPVRIQTSAGDADPTARGFNERWIVMLNGGYDPAMVRGRAVWMLDVWTGQKLWQYTDADFKAVRGDAKASMFPVAATVGLSDVGRLDTLVGASQTDHFFDTATWGDTGGNVFLARLYAPGIIDPSTGLVTNWTASRTFEEARRADDQQYAGGRSQFFYMTQNVPDHPRGLRVLLGSGNRTALMSGRPTCGPDDVFGCAQSGCATVSATSSKNFGAASCSANLGTFGVAGGAMTFAAGAASGCTGTFAAPGPLTATTTDAANCGTAGALASSTTRKGSDSSGLALASPSDDLAFSSSLTFTPSSADPQVPTRMFSFWAYGIKDVKRMAEPLTTAVAKAFDDARFTDVALASCPQWPGSQCQLTEVSAAETRLDVNGTFSPVCLDGSTKCSATAADPGWMYSYGRYCPMGQGQCATSPPWYDEKTGNQGTSFGRCMIWSGFRPAGSSASTDPCTASSGTPTSTMYFADFVTGVPTLATDSGMACGMVDSATNPTVVRRGTSRSAYSAPQNPSLTVAVSAKGQVAYSVKQTDPGGTTNFQLGKRSSTAEPLYWLEVPRAVHACRHGNTATGTYDPSACK